MTGIDKGGSQNGNTPILKGFSGVFKSENSLPLYLAERNEEKALYDLHTVGFLALKSATKMAAMEASKNGVPLCPSPLSPTQAFTAG